MQFNLIARGLSVFAVALAGLLTANSAEAACSGSGCRGYSMGISKGESVYNVTRGSRLATVVAIQSDGKYVLRFSDSGAVGGNWDRSDLAVMHGCIGSMCVGDRVYRVSGDSRAATIVGLQDDGKFVLRFADSGAIGGNWELSDLGKTSGCYSRVCVGQDVYNVTRESRSARVVAIQRDGRYVLRFTDSGAIGGNWDASDLALKQGCSHGLCVGQRAYNVTSSSRAVTIVGIQMDGRFVLRYDDSGAVGGNWDFSDLACM